MKAALKGEKLAIGVAVAAAVAAIAGGLAAVCFGNKPDEGGALPPQETSGSMWVSDMAPRSALTAVSEEDAAALLAIIEAGQWEEGTADCVNNCRLMTDANTIRYHSDCGTFNDFICGRHMPLSEEDGARVNAILEKYISLQVQETAVVELQPTASPEPSPSPSPEPQYAARSGIDTGYPEYDALIAAVQDVQVRREPPTDEEEPFSYIFHWLSEAPVAGYILWDVDGNGVEELIFGENGSDAWDGVVYDLYTMVDGEVVHVFTGGERSRYYFCENGCIAHEGSNGAADSADAYYLYMGTELTLVEAVIFYEGKIYHSIQEDYYNEDLAPGLYREITWEEAEEIRAKYVYKQPQFISFIEPLAEKQR